MIIGDKRRFAIEFELDASKLADRDLAVWLYGRIRWWCGGDAIGRYESDATIRDVATEAARFLAFEGQRGDEYLLSAPSLEVLRTIVRALYEDHGQSDEQVEADDERYRRFLVKPQLDVFDAWDIFLVEGEKAARLIWRRVSEGDLRDCELASGEFDDVLKRFLAALPIATTTAASSSS